MLSFLHMQKKIALNKALFIDRDGVLNEERGYVHTIEQFRFLPGVFDALALFSKAGYLLIVVTNQSGIARGYYTSQEMTKLHSYMLDALKSAGIHIDKVYFCPHHPEGVVEQYAVLCDCRKPNPGMLTRARRDLDLNMNASIIVGDKLTDIIAGKRAGIGHAVLVASGHAIDDNAKTSADFVFNDLLAAANHFTGE